jgi:L-2,4-diaminobutyrate decarboxylase
MTFDKDAATIVEALETFARKAALGDGPVLRQPAIADLARDLQLDHLIRDGGLQGDRLGQFIAAYLSASTRLHHPRYMAHQVAAPLPSSALAALVDAFTNNAMAIYEMGPAAAAVEAAVVAWMRGKTGWPPALEARDGAVVGGGVLTHGGSLANLTALLAARARVAPSAWQNGTPGDLALVVSPASHYSIARSAGIMGLGQNAVRPAPADALGRLDPGKLSAFIAALRAEGRRPLAVVALAGSTALGLYDPLREIADVCREHGVWLHVDGAHGASALISPRLRGHLDGIQHADSLVWDAHKMLRSSTLCAAVLVRDPRALDHAFSEEASYLFHEKDQPGFDSIHWTVECTKAALGLKVFFALACEGEAAIAEMIERQTSLAEAAAGFLRARPGVEVAAEPQSNILCFRLDGPDELQLELRRRLTSDGAFYISTAEALGKRWLRLALMSPNTALADIEALIAELQRLRAAM